jgi:hypothetical protein
MMRTQIGLVLAAIAFAAFSSAVDAASSQVTVPMTAFNDSGQSGTAKFSRSSGDRLTVTIDLPGRSAEAKEPASIHAGSCTDMDRASRVTLNPVVGGKSITTQTLPALGPGTFAIVVRKGMGAGMDTIVSCGEIELH